MKLLFCPECAAVLTKLTDTKYRCVTGHEYFNNARAACAVAFVDQHRNILFAERAREPERGKFDLPGGFVDFGEDATMAAMREAREETGVEPLELQILCTVANTYALNITTSDTVYVCRRWRGDFTPNDDVASVRWEPLSFMDSASFAWRNQYKSAYETLRKTLQ